MVKRLLLIFIGWFCMMEIAAQIHGVVVDANTGEPIPYLNIYYDGKGVGTVTNNDGEYSIAYHAGWTKLTFSMVGYETQEIIVSAKTSELNVSMKEIDQMLDEIIIRPKKEKYSRKNNPAVEMIKKVIASKRRTDLKQKDFYQYYKYQKIMFAKNNITADTTRILAIQAISFLPRPGRGMRRNRQEHPSPFGRRNRL